MLISHTILQYLTISIADADCNFTDHRYQYLYRL